MKILLTIIVLVAIALAVAFVFTRHEASKIATSYQPTGMFVGPEGERTHYMEIGDVPADAPTVIFIHGASGNLLDQYGAFADSVRGRMRALFFDRPGHGWSQRGGADDPAKQAARYVAAMTELGIERAILVGHSLGAASVTAMAVLHPERVSGLVLLSPATHPWPGGVNWYYDVASLPVVGPLFTETLVVPVGKTSLPAGVLSTFEPNAAPADYIDNAAIPLVLRPANFRNNAADVVNLLDFVKDFAPRYDEIKVPVTIITGDTDVIVSPTIHSLALEEQIEGAELIVLEGVGHKPDYVATQTAIDAIERIAAQNRK